MPRAIASGRTLVPTASTPRVAVRSANSTLFFNGTGSSGTTKIALGNVVAISSLTSFTVEGWIKPSSVSSGGSIMNCNYSYASVLGWEFKYSQAFNKLVFYQGNLSVSSATNSVPFNSWSHVVATYNGTQVQFYVNGVASGSLQALTAVSQGSNGIFLGAEGGTSVWYGGSMYNINVFGSALSPADIANRFNGLAASVNPVASYLLSEGTGSTAYDTSGNGNNGTITAGTYTIDTPFTARQAVGGNLIYNPGFEYAPPTNVAQTTTGVVNGTAGGGGSFPIFGWSLSALTGSGSCQFDNTNYHSGSYSFKVSTTAVSSQTRCTDGIGYTQNAPRTILILPNTSYTITWWQKTTINSGACNTGGQLVVNERNTAGTVLAQHFGTGQNATTGWTQYSMTFTSNATSTWLDIELYATGNDGTGTAILDSWFDDLFLQQTTLPTRTVAS